MPSEFNDRRASKPQQVMGSNPLPPQTEPLPCPRCDSINTKFCYYNNYNLSQPRYFCKSCRRYWTHGGTLRNIPVGGGTRKSTKRPRSSSSPSSSSSSVNHEPIPRNPISIFSGMDPSESGSGPGNTSFTSLLTLGGYGLGITQGFDEMGFGLGKGVWSFPEFGNDVVVNGGGYLGTSSWQLNGVETGLVDADCFSWPDLAIATPSNALKQ